MPVAPNTWRASFREIEITEGETRFKCLKCLNFLGAKTGARQHARSCQAPLEQHTAAELDGRLPKRFCPATAAAPAPLSQEDTAAAASPAAASAGPPDSPPTGGVEDAAAHADHDSVAGAATALTTRAKQLLAVCLGEPAQEDAVATLASAVVSEGASLAGRVAALQRSSSEQATALCSHAAGGSLCPQLAEAAREALRLSAAPGQAPLAWLQVPLTNEDSVLQNVLVWSHSSCRFAHWEACSRISNGGAKAEAAAWVVAASKDGTGEQLVHVVAFLLVQCAAEPLRDAAPAWERLALVEWSAAWTVAELEGTPCYVAPAAVDVALSVMSVRRLQRPCIMVRPSGKEGSDLRLVPVCGKRL